MVTGGWAPAALPLNDHLDDKSEEGGGDDNAISDGCGIVVL